MKTLIRSVASVLPNALLFVLCLGAFIGDAYFGTHDVYAQTVGDDCNLCNYDPLGFCATTEDNQDGNPEGQGGTRCDGGTCSDDRDDCTYINAGPFSECDCI